METLHHKTRHNRYKPGVVKLTVTVDNADYVRAKRKAERVGYPTTSAWLRALIHEDVFDEPLTPSDKLELKRLLENQKR